MKANKNQRQVRTAACFVFVLGCSLFMSGVTKAQECPDPAPQTSGTLNFRRLGETFEIPIAMGDCQAISLMLRWTNGRNNGALLNLTFLDGDDRPLYMKQVSAYMSGMFEFPLMPIDQPNYGSMTVQSAPAMVIVQPTYPFGPPAFLSYTVNRANRRPRSRLRGIDSKLASYLQTAPGKLITSTSAYTMMEVALPEPRELELPAKRKTVRSVFRIVLSPATVAGLENTADLMWIDDIAVPIFRNSGSNLGALIFDEAVLKNGAEIAVSNAAVNRLQTFPDRLTFEAAASRSQSDLALSEEGNTVSIKNSARVIGGKRQPLVQIQLRTNRPFPARDTALRLQVGRKLFLDELSGDFAGRTLTMTLTPEMFAELRDGAAIMAFYSNPDGSGSSGNDVWYFGRLNKSRIE